MEVSNILFLVILSFTLFNMDFKHKIIQWNCRGLKPKFDEIKLLLSQHKSSVICLQETFLKRDDTITLKDLMYTIIYILNVKDHQEVPLSLLNLPVLNGI